MGYFVSITSSMSLIRLFFMGKNGHIPASPLAVQQALLAEQLQLLLADLHPELRADVLLALQAPGKLLSDTALPAGALDVPVPTSSVLPAGVWPLLTLLVAQYLAPQCDPLPACIVALAVECFICALDLLDDAEDGDWTPLIEAIGVPRALNVSTTLLTLAHRSILSLAAYGVAPERILLLLATLQEASLTATAGQHQDLLAEQKPVEVFNQEACLAIAAGKAGALMRLAWLLGALSAGVSDDLCEQCAKLGELLGIAHQLDNDCHDLSTLLYTKPSLQDGRAKTDLLRSKKTLPIVLAATAQKASLQLQTPQADDKKQENEGGALREGILTTWGICLLYRERARDCLQEIAACSGPITPALHLLLGL
jgi:geranylgeranyl pyrophosphate synthase